MKASHVLSLEYFIQGRQSVAEGEAHMNVVGDIFVVKQKLMAKNDLVF